MGIAQDIFVYCIVASVCICISLTAYIIYIRRTLGQGRLAYQELSYQYNTLLEKNRLNEESRQLLTDQFRHLSNEALLHNNESFMGLAKNIFDNFLETAKQDLHLRQQNIGSIVEPIQKALGLVDEKISMLEKERLSAYVDLSRQVRELVATQNQLRFETASLVKALRTPTARGQWGEIQLKRVVEMAGMLNHCDFVEQQGINEGKLRPDMVINLPGGKSIVVDAKTPLSAYLNAIESQDDDERSRLLDQHAQQIRTHVRALSQRAYWDQFDESPDFVVMFLPGESFFSAALEKDPSLIEFGVKERVIIATPTTLIALLRAVAFGWRQESLADNAKAVANLGRELYKRIGDMTGHLARMGKNVSGIVDSYNSTIGTFERRVLVSARRFTEFDAQLTTTELDALSPLDSAVRRLQPDTDSNEQTQEDS